MKLSFSFIIILIISITLVYNCSNEDVESELQVRAQYTLTVSAGEGGYITPEATGTYDEGAQLTLSAIPYYGYSFCRWLGTNNDNLVCKNSELGGARGKSRCIIKMNSNRYAKAFFERNSQ